MSARPDRGPARHHVQVAAPAPVRGTFDYTSPAPVPPGSRVLAPFGARKVVGVVLSNEPATTRKSLKPIHQVLDQAPTFNPALVSLLTWAAAYYHHPVGEVFSTALPAHLRRAGAGDDPSRVRQFSVNQAVAADAAEQSLSRSPSQRQLYRYLRDGGWTSLEDIRADWSKEHTAGPGRALTALLDKQLIRERSGIAPPPPAQRQGGEEIILNPRQKQVTGDILSRFGGFSSHLLYGVTGSGKTEIYIELAKKCLADNRQALILVPEIALTPQLVERFRQRFDGVCVMHSGITDFQRYLTWWRARNGSASIILGARSAVFTPLENPGLIVVDEEHDRAYKQQDGFRYHARDVAIKRASLENIPVVLGSATPSLESMKNAESGPHQLHTLGERGGAARLPEIRLVDLKQHTRTDGVTGFLAEELADTLEHNHQAVLFINRRGFAPLAHCPSCDWRANCERCDASLTLHHKTRCFRCHHCGRTEPPLENCPSCGEKLRFTGSGTQRIESALRRLFPESRLCRFDRDEITRHEDLERRLGEITRGEVDLVIGTQLIAKGHDFPGVTLVGIIDPDQGLFSADFRAPEYLFQQLTQVSGRAGRGDTPGRVIIQTAHPQNPYIQIIAQQDADRFYRHCKQERRAAGLPPYGYIALWRAESTVYEEALKFLSHARRQGLRLRADLRLDDVSIMDPTPSPMEKRAGRYRAQLLVQSPQRKTLHHLLSPWVRELEAARASRKVRWSLDVDPVEMF